MNVWAFLFSPARSKMVSLQLIYKDGFEIKWPTKVDMPWKTIKQYIYTYIYIYIYIYIYNNLLCPVSLRVQSAGAMEYTYSAEG